MRIARKTAGRQSVPNSRTNGIGFLVRASQVSEPEWVQRVHQEDGAGFRARQQPAMQKRDLTCRPAESLHAVHTRTDYDKPLGIRIAEQGGIGKQRFEAWAGEGMPVFTQHSVRVLRRRVKYPASFGNCRQSDFGGGSLGFSERPQAGGVITHEQIHQRLLRLLAGGQGRLAGEHLVGRIGATPVGAASRVGAIGIAVRRLGRGATRRSVIRLGRGRRDRSDRLPVRALLRTAGLWPGVRSAVRSNVAGGRPRSTRFRNDTVTVSWSGRDSEPGPIGLIDPGLG
jgi:hypothetical protein